MLAATPRMSTGATRRSALTTGFCANPAWFSLLLISALTEYCTNSWMLVMARSSRNSFVNTVTEPAVSRSEVLSRLPARVFSAAYPRSRLVFTVNGLNSTTSPEVAGGVGAGVTWAGRLSDVRAIRTPDAPTIIGRWACMAVRGLPLGMGRNCAGFNGNPTHAARKRKERAGSEYPGSMYKRISRPSRCTKLAEGIINVTKHRTEIADPTGNRGLEQRYFRTGLAIHRLLSYHDIMKNGTSESGGRF